MKSVPMVVVVFELPPGAGESLVHEVLDDYTRSAPCDIDALHVFGIDAESMRSFRDGVAQGRLREQTQGLLRRLGDEGESFIRREQEFHFIWMSSVEHELGPMHVLFIVPDSEALAAGLCLNRFRPAVN